MAIARMSDLCAFPGLSEYIGNHPGRRFLPGHHHRGVTDHELTYRRPGISARGIGRASSRARSRQVTWYWPAPKARHRRCVLRNVLGFAEVGTVLSFPGPVQSVHLLEVAGLPASVQAPDPQYPRGQRPRREEAEIAPCRIGLVSDPDEGAEPAGVAE